MEPVLEKIAIELHDRGWKSVSCRSHAGVSFDLVGTQRFLVNKWTALIRRVPHFDKTAAQALAGDFKLITSKSKSLFHGARFIFCVVADDVDLELVKAFAPEAAGISGLFRFRAMAGKILIADLSAAEVYGKVPSLPYDAHKFTKQLRSILLHCPLSGVG